MPAEEGKPGQFKASKSAAELAYGDAEGYAEPGTAEHKAAGNKHLDNYWFRGSGGLRPEGHDYKEEEERLHELEEHQKGGAVQGARRAMGAVGGAISSAAAAVTPARFKTSKSAAELAMGDSEGYAEPGLAEHKDHPDKHLGTYWHRGSAGLRPEGHDYKEEEDRLHELEAHQKPGTGGVMERVQEAAATATQTAKEYVQASRLHCLSWAALGVDVSEECVWAGARALLQGAWSAWTDRSRSLARQPWAQQLAAALAAVGVQLDLADPQPVSRAAVRAGCQERQLEQLMAAAERSGATKVQHYVLGTRGGTIDAASLNVPAAYLSSVRERSRRRALAQWRTGSFWGLEETGRWQQLPREQRICPHCQGGIETVHHMIFDCPLYDAIRLRFPDLFNCPATLHAFFEQPAQRLAPFAAACRRCWLDASLTTP